MKKIWIANHYARGSFYQEAGRHYWMAKNLNEKGYDVSVFSAENKKNLSKLYTIKTSSDNICYFFVRAGKNKGIYMMKYSDVLMRH